MTPSAVSPDPMGLLVGGFPHAAQWKGPWRKRQGGGRRWGSGEEEGKEGKEEKRESHVRLQNTLFFKLPILFVELSGSKLWSKSIELIMFSSWKVNCIFWHSPISQATWLLRKKREREKKKISPGQEASDTPNLRLMFMTGRWPWNSISTNEGQHWTLQPQIP